MEKSGTESAVSSSSAPSSSTASTVPSVPTRKRVSRSTRAKDLMRNSQVMAVSAAPPPPSHSVVQYKSILPTVQLCLSGELIDIPQKCLENEKTFRTIISKSTYWSLSEPARNYLRRLLPFSSNKEENRKVEENELLDCVFITDNNFCFGNPISKIFRRIKNGHFNVQHIADEVQLRGYHRVLYDHHIRHYYVNLLNKVLIARQAPTKLSVQNFFVHDVVILEQASTIGLQEKIIINPKSYISTRKLKHAKALQMRAKIRASRMIQCCDAKAGDFETSSDENVAEEERNTNAIPLAPGAESTLYSKKYSEYDFDLHQPVRTKDTKELFREYRHLCETEPDCPSYDISDICLEEVYERTGVSFQSERNFATNFIEQQRRDDSSVQHLSSTPTVTTNSLSSDD